MIGRYNLSMSSRVLFFDKLIDHSSVSAMHIWAQNGFLKLQAASILLSSASELFLHENGRGALEHQESGCFINLADNCISGM